MRATIAAKAPGQKYLWNRLRNRVRVRSRGIAPAGAAPVAARALFDISTHCRAATKAKLADFCTLSRSVQTASEAFLPTLRAIGNRFASVIAITLRRQKRNVLPPKNLRRGPAETPMQNPLALEIRAFCTTRAKLRCKTPRERIGRSLALNIQRRSLRKPRPKNSRTAASKALRRRESGTA